VLLNVSGNAETLTEVIEAMPFLKWVHSITAGVDHIRCPALFDNPDITLTNAKGVFSSTLAEYTMLACSYFAKDVPRWMRAQKDRNWEKYPVRELRGSTMGIVGYVIVN
jgi:phosphoglycerate dehydrogenase-like enzyme